MDEHEIKSVHIELGELCKNEASKSYLNRVYMWVALSMAVTAGVAIYATHNENLMLWTLEHCWLVYIGTLLTVLIMFFAVKALSVMALQALLALFSVAEGLLFGPILIMYTQESLGLTFACTAATFGVMSLYGAFTKHNLGPWGRWLFMCLIGLIIGLVINCFAGSDITSYVLSAIGVVLFSAFTAYDTQQLLLEGAVLQGKDREKGVIIGALDLFIDIINLFLFLLRFLGDRR